MAQPNKLDGFSYTKKSHGSPDNKATRDVAADKATNKQVEYVSKFIGAPKYGGRSYS